MSHISSCKKQCKNILDLFSFQKRKNKGVNYTLAELHKTYTSKFKDDNSSRKSLEYHIGFLTKEGYLKKEGKRYTPLNNTEQIMKLAKIMYDFLVSLKLESYLLPLAKFKYYLNDWIANDHYEEAMNYLLHPVTGTRHRTVSDTFVLEYDIFDLYDETELFMLIPEFTFQKKICTKCLGVINNSSGILLISRVIRPSLALIEEDIETSGDAKRDLYFILQQNISSTYGDTRMAGLCEFSANGSTWYEQTIDDTELSSTGYVLTKYFEYFGYLKAVFHSECMNSNSLPIFSQGAFIQELPDDFKVEKLAIMELFRTELGPNCKNCIHPLDLSPRLLDHASFQEKVNYLNTCGINGRHSNYYAFYYRYLRRDDPDKYYFTGDHDSVVEFVSLVPFTIRENEFMHRGCGQ